MLTSACERLSFKRLVRLYGDAKELAERDLKLISNLVTVSQTGTTLKNT